MFDIILTAMLLSMPFFIMQKPGPQSGLHIGLWISLFFSGRLHAGLSVLVFAIVLFDFLFTRQPLPAETSHPAVKRTHAPQFIIFLSAMIIFCALGKIFPAYGAYMQLDSMTIKTANIAGFVCALAGPVFFGWLSDQKGPFPAMVSLILLAASSVCVTAYAMTYPIGFTIGTGLLWLSVSGTFVLMPILTTLYFGRSHLIKGAPRLILLLTALWTSVYYVIETDSQQVVHSTTFLIYGVYLVLIAALFSFLAWKNRLVIVKTD